MSANKGKSTTPTSAVSRAAGKADGERREQHPAGNKPAAAATQTKKKPAAKVFAPKAVERKTPVKRDTGPLPALADPADSAAVVAANHRDPFGFLGMHELAPGGLLVVRAFQPQAVRVWVVESARKRVVAELAQIHEAGLFAGVIEGRKQRFAYHLAIETSAGAMEIEDPYRFPPVLGDDDVHRLADGNHTSAYEKLGAHPTTLAGVSGVTFAVWAPHAGRVAVIGEFNDWDGRRHGMRHRHAPVEQPEIARSVRQLGAAQEAEHAIEGLRRPLFQRRIIAAICSLGIDDVVALVPQLDEPGDRRGRVLEVTVHDDDPGTSRMFEAGSNGDLLTEIAAERDGPEAGISGVQLSKRLERPVAGAIVDDDHFERVPERFESAGELRRQRSQRALLVKHGDDDRKRPKARRNPRRRRADDEVFRRERARRRCTG